MKKKLAILLFSGLLAAGSVATAQKHTILTVRDSFADSTTVVPQSFETDTEALMQNWYLQNYTILDENVEGKSTGDTSEEVYIKRLSQMPTTIEMPYNAEVRRFIDMYVEKKRTLVEAMLGMSLYYMPIFEQALEAEGLPLELKYLPVVESALDPVAKSPVGAAGLWQFMIRTGKGLGLEINSLVDERLDPYKSSEKAVKYLKELYKIYGDWSLAIAAYNCGPGKVNQALTRAGGKGKDFWQIYAFLPAETRGYVPAFIAANYAMTYHKYHNISPALARKPILVDTISVNQRVHFKQISAVLNIPIEALRVLNPQYRNDVIPGNIRPYTLALPSQQIYCYIMSEDSIYGFDTKKYKQRTVVQPLMEQVASDENGAYTYEKRTVTKTHRVKKGENISKIAKQYGTTVNAIKRDNKLKSNSLTAGQKLKIKVTEQVKVYVKPEVTEEDMAEADSLAILAAATPDDNKRETVKAPADTEKKKKATTKTSDTKDESDKNAYTGTHKVSKGESLGKIAERYGITVDELKLANGLKSNNIQVGQRLKVPKTKESNNDTTTIHTVKSGESLSLIAERYGVTVSALKSANGLKNNNLKAGQKLVIPKKQSSKTSRSKAKSSKRRK